VLYRSPELHNHSDATLLRDNLIRQDIDFDVNTALFNSKSIGRSYKFTALWRVIHDYDYIEVFCSDYMRTTKCCFLSDLHRDTVSSRIGDTIDTETPFMSRPRTLFLFPHVRPSLFHRQSTSQFICVVDSLSTFVKIDLPKEIFFLNFNLLNEPLNFLWLSLSFGTIFGQLTYFIQKLPGGPEGQSQASDWSELVTMQSRLKYQVRHIFTHTEPCVITQPLLYNRSADF